MELRAEVDLTLHGEGEHDSLAPPVLQLGICLCSLTGTAAGYGIFTTHAHSEHCLQIICSAMDLGLYAPQNPMPCLRAMPPAHSEVDVINCQISISFIKALYRYRQTGPQTAVMM